MFSLKPYQSIVIKDVVSCARCYHGNKKYMARR